jgi:hypothetical protein
LVWEGQNRLNHGFDAAVVGDAPGDGMGRLVVAGENGIAGERVELLRLAGVRRGGSLAHGGAQGSVPAGVRKHGGHVHQPCGRQIQRIAGRQVVPLAKGADGGHGGRPKGRRGLLAGVKHRADGQQLLVQLMDFCARVAGIEENSDHRHRIILSD